MNYLVYAQQIADGKEKKLLIMTQKTKRSFY